MNDGNQDPQTADAPAPDAALEADLEADFEAALVEARRMADENWDRYLRAEAELDNFRKVSQKRVAEAAERRERALLEAFLEVADNLERALAHGDADAPAVVAGVEATHRQLLRLLEREGVARIDALDQPFDPQLHEAVSAVPAPDLTTERVIAVDRPGYTLRGELLRPARVVVGRPQE
jgi:molecular chaperone GrpE